MRVHRTDLVSLTFGLLFLGLSVWWLLAQILGLALPPVGWFLAGALVVIGLLGLVGALRSGRHDREVPPAAGPEPTEPDPSAAGWPAPPAGPRDTADGFPGPADTTVADREPAPVSVEPADLRYPRDEEAVPTRWETTETPGAERETAEIHYTDAGTDEDALTRPQVTGQETAALGTAGEQTAEVRFAGPDDATAPVWGPDGTGDRFTEPQTRAIGSAGDADEWTTAAISDRPAEAVEDRTADAPDDRPRWSPVEPVSGPPAGERRTPD
ncbi:hypothetical protein GA0074696_1414 [Micromonospora purpureochromogenes]|uniref:Uncharacterized protein n=1 Tax=Micromonospora purpureochromogenes TaxID=47872 RepID=A0A1C4VVT7_9ACTN|nr:hypothetical protein [Micromonospora purpureochromogenes]SCE88087.1 hypothetical protein GA0074696_1414 [Micromonospora purpureochromogenes]